MTMYMKMGVHFQLGIHIPILNMDPMINNLWGAITPHSGHVMCHLQFPEVVKPHAALGLRGCLVARVTTKHVVAAVDGVKGELVCVPWGR